MKQTCRTVYVDIILQLKMPEMLVNQSKMAVNSGWMKLTAVLSTVGWQYQR